MTDYIQIGDDPTKWWLVQPFNANQLTGQPLTLDLAGPLGGWLVLSGRADSVAVFNVPDATVPADFNSTGGCIYLPTGTGASAHNFGYALTSNEAMATANLGSEIATAMRNGTRLTIPLYGGGTLVINGATLTFAVVQPGSLGGSSPHD
jgi:hypothetical protein